MFKVAMVAVLSVALTGCVKYTNSEGEKCTVNLDPAAWVMTGVNAVGAGVDTIDMVHKCESVK